MCELFSCEWSGIKRRHKKDVARANLSQPSRMDPVGGRCNTWDMWRPPRCAGQCNVPKPSIRGARPERHGHALRGAPGDSIDHGMLGRMAMATRGGAAAVPLSLPPPPLLKEKAHSMHREYGPPASGLLTSERLSLALRAASHNSPIK